MRWNIKLILSCAWVFLGTTSFLVAPVLSPFILPLTTLAPLLWYPRSGLARHLWAKSLLARILAVTSVFLLVNATWSTAPILAYIGVATFFVASVVVHVVTRTMPDLDREPIRAMSIGFTGGYIAGALVVAIEVIFNHPFHLHFFELFPSLSPQMIGTVYEGNVLKSLPSYFLNRNAAAVMFLLWPALLVAGRLAWSPRSRAILLLLCLTPVVVGVFASDHETSKMTIAGGAAVFCMQALGLRFLKVFMVAAWTLACIAMVPMASVAYNNLQLHKAEWLQNSARDRIVLWGVTSAKVAEAPVLGHGLVSGRAMGQQAKEHPVYAPDTPYLLTLGPHAHNVYLQVWFDTGLVGAFLMLTIGLFALRAIWNVAADLQPALYAAFATNALMAASSFSIWTRWFLASYAISTVFAVMAWRFAANTLPQDAASGPVRQDASSSTWPGALQQSFYKSSTGGTQPKSF